MRSRLLFFQRSSNLIKCTLYKILIAWFESTLTWLENISLYSEGAIQFDLNICGISSVKGARSALAKQLTIKT